MIFVENRHYFKGEGEYVGRGTPLGNKFSHKQEYCKKEDLCTSVQEAVDRYEEWLSTEVAKKNRDVCDELNRLYKIAKKGDLHLVCSCVTKYNKLCHANVIKSVLEVVVND